MTFSLGFFHRLSVIWSMPDRWEYYGRLLCVIVGLFFGFSAWCLVIAPFSPTGTFYIGEAISATLAALLVGPFLYVMTSHMEEGTEIKGWRTEWIESARKSLRLGFFVGLCVPAALGVVVGLFWLYDYLFPSKHGV